MTATEPPGVGKWRINVHPTADDDMRWMCKQHRATFKEMLRALETLAKSPNIFAVQSPLDITEMYPDAPDHVRFKRRGGRWRCVMRIIKDGQHVAPSCELRPSSDTYLQIIFVDVRTNTTYADVRRRVKDIIYTG